METEKCTKKYALKYRSYKSPLILFLCVVLLVLPILSSCTVDVYPNYISEANNPTVPTLPAEIRSHRNADADAQDNHTNTHTMITPADYISAAKLKANPKKTRTVLFYMNGSDLESEYASATWDLEEMLESQFDEKNINVVIFTGGAKKWHTPNIPNNMNALFTIKNNKLVKLAQIGKDPMGYPETLAGFINAGTTIFPADNYSLILWNHGGGAIVGYGSDERYLRNPGKAMMTLSEIDSALGSTDLYKNGKKFELLGFDTCLMATLEMACIAQKYADYMVASEELEPDPGWDYYFLGEIKPNHSGKEIGELVVDYYKDFYEQYFAYFEIEDIITMSLTDLSKIQAVADAFERFAASKRKEIANGNYSVISKARSRSRMFGSRGERAGETDMIDAGNLAESLSHLIPKESAALLKALSQAVIYKHEAYIEEVGGLSIYFPFVNKDNLDYSLEVYRSINNLPEYTEFIKSFAEVLDSAPMVDYKSVAGDVMADSRLYRNDRNNNNNNNKENKETKENNADKNSNSKNNKLEGEYKISLTPEQIENLIEIHQTTWRRSNLDGRYIQIERNKNVPVSDSGEVTIKFNDVCATLNGHLVCLYELDSSENNHRRYAIPVKLNGDDADLIAVYSDKYPAGKIVGAVPTGDDAFNMLDKKIVQVKPGDKIQILYYAEDFKNFRAYNNNDNNNNKNNKNNNNDNGYKIDNSNINKAVDSVEVNDTKNEMWQKGEEFVVTDKDGLILGQEKLREGEYFCGISFVDIQQNKYYSNFLEIKR